ncbi:MAG: T9SS type A sorting domain-containing protein, partial [Melioribacteraceae bacterium]
KKLLIFLILVMFSTTSFAQDTLSLKHVAGDLSVTIFDEGSIGRMSNGDGAATPAITWKNEEALWFGGLIFGTTDKASINGLAGSFNNSSGGKLVTDMKKVSSTFATGFSTDANFSNISTAVINDSGADVPYNVEITQKVYSNPAESFVIISYEYKNKGTVTLNDFYAGIFIDWDVLSGVSTNIGGYDDATSLVYVADQAAASKFFGIVGCNSIDGYAVSNYNTPDGDTHNKIAREEMFKLISTKGLANVTTAADQRSYQGTKLGNIAAGKSATVTFAIVAGDNLAGIKANATAAKAKAITAGLLVTGVEKEDIVPTEFFVEQNYPNPFNPTTKITFGLASKSNVDLRVYDMLGREVAVLVNNELLSSGTYNSDFNASDLSSGTYVYTLKTNNQVISKKMLLLK